LRGVRPGDVTVHEIAGPVPVVSLLAEGQGVGGVAGEGEVVKRERDVARVGRADVGLDDRGLNAVAVRDVRRHGDAVDGRGRGGGVPDGILFKEGEDVELDGAVVDGAAGGDAGDVRPDANCGRQVAVGV